MKYLFSLSLVLILLSGCTHQSRGSMTWDNTTTIDNPLVETIKAFKGTPVQRYSSQTEANMGAFR